MKRSFLLVTTLALALCVNVALAQNLTPEGNLPRATPESVGVPSDALAETIKRLDEEFSRVDAVMILRDGKVIAEAWRAPNGPQIPHALYSLSKSFCSTAVGFAQAEGKLSVKDKIVDYFQDELPENPDPRLKDVTIEHLLTMSCGHSSDPWGSDLIGTDYGLEPQLSDAHPTWAESFLARKIEYEPGTTFLYNTTGTYMCSAIVQKAVGENIVKYLQPRLFDPLHIDPPYWEQSPQGIDKGGTGLFLKTEDIAKFGQLYLQKGKWNDEQILPEEWIDAATSKHVSNGSDPNSDWAQGYGYQFWRCRHNAYRGDGMYCQFCIVMPDQNIVVAINSDCNNYQGEVNVLFDTLLPAIKDEPLPENEEALAKLHEIEKSLQPKEASSDSEVHSLSLHSDALGRDVNYCVYIPKEYRTTSISYPTLYLLHGLYGNQTNWSDPERGNMRAICDAWFTNHLDKKRIVIMPDGGNLWYRDSLDDSSKYETFFFNELIPEVEKRYRCQHDASSRAIAGLSMGGYGALLYALHRPDMFQSCYAMSPAIRTADEVQKLSFEEFKKRYAATADVKDGDERLTEYFYENDPHTLVTKLSEEDKKRMSFLIDCGDDDSLLYGGYVFFQKAKSVGANCELRVRDGVHDWKYWREALEMTLQFISK
ncbi:MAG: alpha/beta hydrolase-fold protein [Planctomycetia bacterium]|nr:alpha/beta hydrolase-fold protein [Planctomycetia bacterium]